MEATVSEDVRELAVPVEGSRGELGREFGYENLKRPLMLDQQYANALDDIGRTAEAMSQLEQVMRLDVDHARSRVNYGILLVRQGRVEQAIPYYREALRIDPDYPDAHFDLAIALQQIGDETEARRSYRKALDLARAAGREELVTLIEQRLGPGY